MKPFLRYALFTAVIGVTLIFAQKQPQPKSQKEVDAIQAMFQAQDPDSRIKAAEALIVKFADTEFKALALYLIAASYEQKGDVEKMIVYAEETLKADPKDYKPMFMLAAGFAKRTREFDLDKEEKLGKAEKYAKEGIEAVKVAAKPNPSVTDEQWTAAKKDFEAQAHDALGQVAMVRKKYDVATQEFTTALTTAGNPDPVTYIRLAQAHTMSGKPDDALAALDKLNAIADLHPQIKQAAQAERVRATQAKNTKK
ncbi:MAG: tetratricopeptide repeat protein [Bryobacteraceae bacterium]